MRTRGGSDSLERHPIPSIHRKTEDWSLIELRASFSCPPFDDVFVNLLVSQNLQTVIESRRMSTSVVAMFFCLVSHAVSHVLLDHRTVDAVIPAGHAVAEDMRLCRYFSLEGEDQQFLSKS